MGDLHMWFEREREKTCGKAIEGSSHLLSRRTLEGPALVVGSSMYCSTANCSRAIVAVVGQASCLRADLQRGKLPSLGEAVAGRGLHT